MRIILTAILLSLFSGGLVLAQSYAYVANIATDGDGKNVSVIDMNSFTVIDSIDLGNVAATFVAASPGMPFVYVTNAIPSTVSVIEYSVNSEGTLENKVVDTIQVGPEPLGIVVSPDSSTIYVANAAGNTVSVIRASDNTVTDTIDVGMTPFGIAISPDGNTLYVANSGFNVMATTGTVSVISTSDNTVTDTIQITTGTPFSVAVSLDGKFLYVGADNILVYDTSDNSFVETINVNDSDEQSEISLASSPLQNQIFATAGGQLYFINADNNTIQHQTTATTSTISYVAVDPFGQFLVVTKFSEDSAQQFFVGGFENGNSVKVGFQPQGVAIISTVFGQEPPIDSENNSCNTLAGPVDLKSAIGNYLIILFPVIIGLFTLICRQRKKV